MGCGAKGLGAALSDADVAGIKAALEGFLEKALLPALQARVRGLHFQVLHPTYAWTQLSDDLGQSGSL